MKALVRFTLSYEFIFQIFKSNPISRDDWFIVQQKSINKLYFKLCKGFFSYIAGILIEKSNFIMSMKSNILNWCFLFSFFSSRFPLLNKYFQNSFFDSSLIKFIRLDSKQQIRPYHMYSRSIQRFELNDQRQYRKKKKFVTCAFQLHNSFVCYLELGGSGLLKKKLVY